MTDFEGAADHGLLQHPEEPILRFFAWFHLPPKLQEVSRPFGELALWMVEELPRSAERAAGLRKLLEAKDCAVRANLPEPPAYPLIPKSPAFTTATGEDVPPLVQAAIQAALAQINAQYASLLPEGVTLAVDVRPVRPFRVADQGHRLGVTDTRPLVDEDTQP